MGRMPVRMRGLAPGLTSKCFRSADSAVVAVIVLVSLFEVGISQKENPRPNLLRVFGTGTSVARGTTLFRRGFAPQLVSGFFNGSNSGFGYSAQIGQFPETASRSNSVSFRHAGLSAGRPGSLVMVRNEPT